MAISKGIETTRKNAALQPFTKFFAKFGGLWNERGESSLNFYGLLHCLKAEPITALSIP